jgi:ATP/maltotriose-dependent transcriptional regulator MalT
MEKATQEMVSIHHTPLLATKLHMPRPSARLVHRSLLDERLAQGMTCALTLLSAPAGFGKTTLLSDYLTRSATPVAWLSLERGNNDLGRFLSYLGTARAYLTSGEATPAVEEHVATAMSLARASGNLVSFLSSISLLARLQVLQGRLRKAANTYGQAMQVTPERERLQALVNSADYYFGMGDLLREWNELDEAEQHLTQGMNLARGTLTVYAEIVTLGYTALARLQQACGNFRGALATLSAFAELADQRHFVPRLLARDDFPSWHLSCWDNTSTGIIAIHKSARCTAIFSRMSRSG